jgi:hypothetical protein
MYVALQLQIIITEVLINYRHGITQSINVMWDPNPNLPNSLNPQNDFRFCPTDEALVLARGAYCNWSITIKGVMYRDRSLLFIATN